MAQKNNAVKSMGSFEKMHLQSLRSQSFSNQYLQVALDLYQKDGDSDALLLALRDVAVARGGLAKLAVKTKIHRVSLYRILSGKGNPTLNTLSLLLKHLGLRLAIKSSSA